jgi:hypothetical protein
MVQSAALMSVILMSVILASAIMLSAIIPNASAPHKKISEIFYFVWSMNRDVSRNEVSSKIYWACLGQTTERHYEKRIVIIESMRERERERVIVRVLI